MYVDNVQRDNIAFNDNRNTVDVDFQRSWSGMKGHEIVWGSGYRLVTDNILNTTYLNFTPDHRLDNLFNAFVQDKIALVPEEFFITLGSKFEHNDYTGFELQPSARATWLINDRQTLWASASHAIRSPNRFTDDGTIVLTAIGGPAFVATVGNPNLQSETLNAYEMGYRIQPTKKTFIDATTFYNHYGKLVDSSVGGGVLLNLPGLGATPVLDITPVNSNSGTTTGLEITGHWDVTDRWQLDASYTRLNFTVDHPETAGFGVKGLSPKNQFNMRSTVSFPHNLEMNNALYYVDELPASNIDAYVRFDTRISWKAMENLELSLVGQNLFDNSHQEFAPFLYMSSAEVPRAFYGNITWKF
jgi:iron complex outermembrane receptor protein